ncbi:hypothetical protein [Paraburkholderia aromaticivorans]|uniref:hypothetical protein n=1 Tax=Paraburkholderia aromaticivorans TaxID=2026199 RepID=UPI0038BA5FEF
MPKPIDNHHGRETRKLNHQQTVEAIELLKNEYQRLPTVKEIHDLTGISIVTLYQDQYVRDNLMLRTYKHKKRQAKPLPTNATASYKLPTLTSLYPDLKGDPVEQYAAYIKDTYFAHSEPVKEVQTDMATSVKNFVSLYFQQAINRLRLDGTITESKHKPGYFHQSKPEPVTIPAYEHQSTSTDDVALDTTEEEAPGIFDSAGWAIGTEEDVDNAIKQFEQESTVAPQKSYVIFDQYMKQYAYTSDDTLDDDLMAILKKNGNLKLTVYVPVKIAQNIAVVEDITIKKNIH